jgi:hypothetical protein
MYDPQDMISGSLWRPNYNSWISMKSAQAYETPPEANGRFRRAGLAPRKTGVGAKEPTAPRAGTDGFHTAATFCVLANTISMVVDQLQIHPATESIAQFGRA